jgi:hypothetical protein
MKTQESKTGSQLELGFAEQGAGATGAGGMPAPQQKLAEWWFARMREVVDNSPRWTPGPEALEFHPLEVSRKLVLADY